MNAIKYLEYLKGADVYGKHYATDINYFNNVKDIAELSIPKRLNKSTKDNMRKFAVGLTGNWAK